MTHSQNSSQSVWGDSTTQFFYQLDPHTILNAAETQGFSPTGAVNALNSMENRVVDIQLSTPTDETSAVIAKFYRPGRWSREQIQDEHDFLLALADAEIPAIAPIIKNDNTVFQLDDSDIFYAFFPKQRGRSVDEFDEPQLEQLGRLLARVHQVGEQQATKHRLRLDPENFAKNNVRYLRDSQCLPADIESNYCDAVEQLVETIEPYFSDMTSHAIHGDCHKSNIIWQEDRAMLVDFDDMVIGPAVQDIWLLVPGRDTHAKQQRTVLLSEYENLRDFDWQSLRLIEPLRALRMVHFSHWLARRADDPAFQQAFPFFFQGDYWYNALQDLFEQIHVINDAL